MKIRDIYQVVWSEDEYWTMYVFNTRADAEAEIADLQGKLKKVLAHIAGEEIRHGEDYDMYEDPELDDMWNNLTGYIRGGIDYDDNPFDPFECIEAFEFEEFPLEIRKLPLVESGND